MTSAGLTVRLIWRDPVRRLAFLLTFVGALLLAVSPPSAGAYWVGLCIAPVFLISAALAVPTFSAFESAMPIERSQLLWARILATLGTLWLPLLAGVPAMYLVGRPLADARQPLAFAILFTASICLATSARVRPRPAGMRWTLAVILALAALACLPWPATLAIAALAALPWAARLWWTYFPEWRRPGFFRTGDSAFWPTLRLFWSWRTLLTVPLAFAFGWMLNWSSLPFVGILLTPDNLRQPLLRGLPISRRRILWMLLLPTFVPFLAGLGFGYGAGQRSWTPQVLVPSTPTLWRNYSCNPPGLCVPLDYYRFSSSPRPPMVVAPWGETAQPPAQDVITMSGSAPLAYNPYWVGPQNTDRFFEWQFGRATQAIYGKTLRPDQLPAALGAGLKPLARQPRMQTLGVFFGAAALLLLALLAAVSEWHRAPAMRDFLWWALRPVGLPFLGMLLVIFLVPHKWASFDPWSGLVLSWMRALSALLPTNFALLTLLLLAALAPLYWALEKAFKRVEFLPRRKETT